MRPNTIEVIRGLQAALATSIGQEVQSAYGQAEVQNAVMLLESLAAEWDTAAQTLVEDNRALTRILKQGRSALAALAAKSAEVTSLMKDLRGTTDDTEGDGSFAISVLAARNSHLRSLLERLLAAGEDAVGDAALEPLMAVRREAYQHLRRAAARGWSFWDALSFRERMAQERAGDSAT